MNMALKHKYNKQWLDSIISKIISMYATLNSTENHCVYKLPYNIAY